MSYFIPTVGVMGRLRSLTECLREVHEARRAGVLEREARRVECGGAKSPDTDFDVIKDKVGALQELANVRDAVGLQETLLEIGRVLEAPEEDPGEFVEDEEIEGLSVRLRAVDADAYQAMKGRVNALGVAIAQSKEVDEQLNLLGELLAEKRAFVQIGIGEVCGFVIDDDGTEAGLVIKADPELGLSEQDLDILERSERIGDLFRAAQFFQELSGNVQRRFGEFVQLTSANSTVKSAPPDSTPSLDASAEPSTLTSPEPISRPTPAPGGS